MPCGILVSWLDQTSALEVEVWRLKHWTTGGFPRTDILKGFNSFEASKVSFPMGQLSCYSDPAKMWGARQTDRPRISWYQISWYLGYQSWEDLLKDGSGDEGRGRISMILTFWLEQFGGDGVLDTLPHNTASWDMDYFRLKVVGRIAEAGESCWSWPFSLEVTHKTPIRGEPSLSLEERNILISKDKGTPRRILINRICQSFLQFTKPIIYLNLSHSSMMVHFLLNKA